MKRKVLLALILIMSVSASLAFAKPINGKILHPGFAMEQRGGDILPYLDKDLYYQPDAGCIMLRPDLELKSMGGSSPKWTDNAGWPVTVSGGSWELVTLPGLPEVKLLHQKDVTAKTWEIKTSDTYLADNQGFVVYWKKYATPTGSSPNIFILAGYGTSYYIAITLEPRKQVIIEQLNPTTNYTKEYKVAIPASYMPAETDIESLVCFFVDNYIILGFNGVDKTLAIKCDKYDSTTDYNGATYPKIMNSGYLAIDADGAGLFGFKKLTYSATGNLVSPYYMPGCNPSASTVAKLTKVIKPDGTDITGYWAGKSVQIEGTPGSGTPTGRLRYGFILRGATTQTPYLYSWRVKDPLTRTGSAGSPNTLSSDIIAYQEDITGNKDGSFGDWTSQTKITCYNEYYDTIFTGRNTKITLSLNPGNGLVQRAVHYADTLEISRDEPGDLTLNISAQSIVKRLKLTPILRPESFDDRQWRHGDLMSYLCLNLGGVTIVNGSGVALSASDYSTDPLLLSSGLTDRPAWQFNPGTSIWEAMNCVREYSGWLLYPDNNNQIIYKPFPTSASTPDWTIDMQTCRNLKYTIADLAKTRFMVLGQAGADDSAGRYRSGDGIMVYKTNSTLETALGESRPLWVFDPALSSVDMVNNFCLKLYAWYGTLHKIVQFTIPDFTAYKSMTLNQVASISDSQITDIAGVYMITGVHLTGDISLVSASCELISL